MLFGPFLAAILWLFLGAVLFSAWARFLELLLEFPTLARAIVRSIPHMIASLPNVITSLCDTLENEGSHVWRDLKPLTKTPRIVNILTGLALGIVVYTPGLVCLAIIALLFSILVYGFVNLTLSFIHQMWSMLGAEIVVTAITLVLVVLTQLFFESHVGRALLSFLERIPWVLILIVTLFTALFMK